MTGLLARLPCTSHKGRTSKSCGQRQIARTQQNTQADRNFINTARAHILCSLWTGSHEDSR
jgi:hypothetical protein